MFQYSDIGKRYHTLDYHFKKKFGRKMVKIPLNAGFTCPNLDGTRGIGGCIYCSDKRSGDFAGKPADTILQQLLTGRELVRKKWQSAGIIAYLQAGSNTYAPMPVLKNLYEDILSINGVEGLSIATRADCITEELAEYLKLLSKKRYISIELGLQTIHDSTATEINRGHSFSEFLTGLELIRSENIEICVHLINGLPNETCDMMLETAKTVGQLGIQGVKLHLLHVLEATALADKYISGEYTPLEMDEYIDIIVNQLCLLPPEIVIQRLTGDGDASILLAPLWSKNKRAVLNGIDKKMADLNLFQGCNVK